MRRGRTPATVAALLLTAMTTGCTTGSLASPSSPLGEIVDPATEPPGPAPVRPSPAAMTGRTVETGSTVFVVPAGSRAERKTIGRKRLVTSTSVVLRSPLSPCVVRATDLSADLEFRFEDAVDFAVGLNDRRLTDREVGGERVYVATGPARAVQFYEIGRAAGDTVVSLTFLCRRPEADRTQRFVEAVLATVTWKT